MEGLPHALRPVRLPGRGRVPGLERRWQHSGKPVRAVPRRARSHDATRHNVRPRTARHNRATRRKARVDPHRRLPHDHVPPDQPRLALRHLQFVHEPRAGAEVYDLWHAGAADAVRHV